MIFFTKKSLSVFRPCKKIPFVAQIGFLVHFCHFGLVTSFWFGQKTKSDLFHKRITSYLMSEVIWWQEKLATVLPQNYFGKFCYCGPPWGIFIHGYFESIGGLLWPYGSLWLCKGHFFQIHFETLQKGKKIKQFSSTWAFLRFWRSWWLVWVQYIVIVLFIFLAHLPHSCFKSNI